METSRRIVLDTNVVLDWLVFRNAECDPLVRAIERGQLRWVATSAMRDELAHVIGRGVVRDRAPDESALWTAWDRWATLVEPVASQGPATRLRCTDPDDQKFIDLAVAHADWLISRDRAVLKLARRARPLGLLVLTPSQWVLE